MSVVNFALSTQKKEYAQYFFRADETEEYQNESKTLKLRKHQMLMSTYMNPNNYDITRLILYHSTGSGKTKNMIGIAQGFARIYEEQTRKGLVTPQIYILGYNRDVFVDTLMRTPEFGYVTADEVEYLDMLYMRHISQKVVNPQYTQEYRDQFLRLRNRISMTQIGGYYKFFGYMEFANKLGYGEEKIEINQLFLDSLRGALIIADEVHNTYNTDTLNNAGEAIKYTLNYHGDNIYFVGASATPINNNPTEIVDLISMVTGKEVNKHDIFNIDGRSITLRESAVPGLKNLLAGKISFYKDIDPTAYPPFVIVSEGDIPGIDTSLTENTMKFAFVRCKMPAGSPQETLLKQYKTDEIYISDYMIRDMVVPGMVLKQSDDPTIKTGIIENPRALKIPEFSIEDLGQYAIKYKYLYDLLPKLNGKTLIFHNRVNGTGIRYIEQQCMLKQGYITEDQEPSPNTPCAICNVRMKVHDAKKQGHEYTPARFNMIYSELEPLQQKMNMRAFNAPQNCDGTKVKFQLGAEMVIQSVDYSCLMNIVIVSFPDNFPNLIQLIGRAIRRDSHKLMPPGFPPVQIFILVTSYDNNSPERPLTFEESYYLRKYKWFVEICKLQYIFEDVSINKYINNDLGIPAADIKSEEFFAYGYYENEAFLVNYLIEQAFSRQAVFTIDDLWHFVVNRRIGDSDPKIRVDLNSNLFDRDLFDVIIYDAIYKHRTLICAGKYISTAENFKPLLNPVSNKRDKIISINIEEIRINNLLSMLRHKLAPDTETYILRHFNGDIHIQIIRQLLLMKDRAKWAEEALVFYKKYGVVRNNTSFIDVRSGLQYNLNEEKRVFDIQTVDVVFNKILGYYDSEMFKIIEISSSSSNNKDKRKNKRGMSCMSLPKDEIAHILRKLQINTIGRDQNNTKICEIIENHLLKEQIKNHGRIVYFSVLGR